jgi:hypothetical protein
MLNEIGRNPWIGPLTHPEDIWFGTEGNVAKLAMMTFAHRSIFYIFNDPLSPRIIAVSLSPLPPFF